ncbi:MAG: outer membrane protein assembly factor BamE [Sphingomonadales bacterium]
MINDKGTRGFSKKIIIIFACATILSGCTINQSLRGYVADEDLIQAITPGIDNFSSVRDTLGNPTITGTFDTSTWYYIATNTLQKSFFHEQANKHMVMVVKFDPTGVVDNVQRLDLNDMQTLTAVADETPSRGKELGFWEQIFGNVGRFAASAPGRPAGGPR